jgi:hypothetical protein
MIDEPGRFDAGIRFRALTDEKIKNFAPESNIEAIALFGTEIRRKIGPRSAAIRGYRGRPER